MIKRQTSLTFSPYMSIYDLIIPKDNLLRQMKELVDFSFIYHELIEAYCPDKSIHSLVKSEVVE